MSFEEAKKKFKIEDNARGYVEATIMPYLTAGFEELLNVAKERGELKVTGDDGNASEGKASRTTSSTTMLEVRLESLRRLVLFCELVMEALQRTICKATEK